MGLSPKSIRVLALGGTVLGCGSAALLVFASARMRALGSHEGLFNFDQASLFETYNDGLGISITAIGTVSVIWALREGYRGFSDLPGFSEAYQQATTDIDEVAEELVDDAIDIIEVISGDALDNAEDALDATTEGPTRLKSALTEQARLLEQHNQAVITAKEEATRTARKKSGVIGFIAGRSVKPALPDVSAYDDLILPRIDSVLDEIGSAEKTDATEIREAMHRLEAASSAAIARMRARVAESRATAPDLDGLFDEGDDEDGTS